MIKKYLFLLSVCTPALFSCSDISEDERFIAMDKVEATRTVLLEEFTGQDCPNCPAAHRTLAALSQQYGDKLIPVSIHAGDLAISCTARRPGLMQPEGNSYNDRYNITEWPKGVIDGRSGALNPDQWSDYLRQELALPAYVGIDVEASIASGDEPKIVISYSLEPSADIAGTLHLWVLEDGIVARQSDKEAGGVVSDYVHNHVYRAAVNGVDGTPVNLKSGVHLTGEASIAVRNTEKEKWNADNLSIVAFIRLADGTIAHTAKCEVLR